MKRCEERDAAKAQGKTRYFTGQPCIRGHIAERMVSNWCCVICLAEASKKYPRKDTPQIREKRNKRARQAYDAGSFSGDNVRIDFYVYVIFRPTGIPCYVGKGRGRRLQKNVAKTHNPHLAAIIKNANGNVPMIKIRENMTDYEARKLEIAFIAAIGREIHGGPLVNQTDGGDGAVNLDPEIRKAIGAKTKGVPKGPQSPEHKAAESAWQKGIPKGPMSPESLASRRATIAASNGPLSIRITEPPKPHVRRKSWRDGISASLKERKKSSAHCMANAESQRRTWALKKAFAEMLGAS